jgi:hypothetical protein
MSRSAGGICAKPQLGDRAASQGSVSNRPRIAVGKPSLQSTAAVSRTYLSKLEMAATYPGLEIIAKLATVLEIEPASCSPEGTEAKLIRADVRSGPSAAPEIRARPTVDAQKQAAQPSSSISAFASLRSGVSKPSVNQP